jgi:hypothetical protein
MGGRKFLDGKVELQTLLNKFEEKINVGRGARQFVISLGPVF